MTIFFGAVKPAMQQRMIWWVKLNFSLAFFENLESRNIMACTEPINDAVGDDADDKIFAEDADN